MTLPFLTPDAPRVAPAYDHPLNFDPTYGYDLEALLRMGAPEGPADLVSFWHQTYDEAMQVPLRTTLRPIENPSDEFELFEIEFDSLGGVRIGGWMTLPRDRASIERGIVVSHGYGGRMDPPGAIPGPPAAAIFPCARGLGARSYLPGVSVKGDEHVVVGIESRDTYILRGCAADIWCAASALIEQVPEIASRLQYTGSSFGGGQGGLALAWDPRFVKAHLGVPTFGNHPLRVTLPCKGSGAGVKQYYEDHPEVLDVLQYFDAATNARHTHIPVQCECALFDPSVPPPGQFAVFNALAGPKELLVRPASHFACPEKEIYDAISQQKQGVWFST
jgi:cephalosporin-C deacetylase